MAALEAAFNPGRSQRASGQGFVRLVTCGRWALTAPASPVSGIVQDAISLGAAAGTEA